MFLFPPEKIASRAGRSSFSLLVTRFFFPSGEYMPPYDRTSAAVKRLPREERLLSNERAFRLAGGVWEECAVRGFFFPNAKAYLPLPAGTFCPSLFSPYWARGNSFPSSGRALFMDREGVFLVQTSRLRAFFFCSESGWKISFSSSRHRSQWSRPFPQYPCWR